MQIKSLKSVQPVQSVQSVKSVKSVKPVQRSRINIVVGSEKLTLFPAFLA